MKLVNNSIFLRFMSDFETLLEKAKAFHGDACPGILMGTRMTMAGMRELGMNPMEKNRDLIVYVEIDRCATDAIQAITGVTLGHRTLKFRDYGKFAATFVDSRSGKAVRVTAIPKKGEKEQDFRAIAQNLAVVPESELFTIQKVTVTIPDEDLPGQPTHKEFCSTCGEQILDNSEMNTNGIIQCKNCAFGSYYIAIE